MRGKEKTKEQLMDELVKLRQQITKLQKSETKHQQIEETLCESKEKYRILLEATTDCILIETVEGRVLESNTAGAKMFGYNKKDMIGLTIADRVPEEFANKLPKVITEKEATQGFFVPRISKKKDGTIFPTEIATKIVNIKGKPRLITYVRDITKRKETEKKLKKARKMFTSLFSSSPEAALYHDKDSHIININPRFTELFGYTPEEIIGKKIDEGMIYPENKIEEGKILTKKAFNGFSDYETIRKKKDGTLIPVIISTAPVIIDKKPQGTIALYKDITERKRAEENLQKSQQEFASLFEGSPQAAIYHDEKGLILNINSRFTELFGYTLEEVKDKNINQGIIFPQDKTREESKKLTKSALEGKVVEHETIRKKKDGTLVPVIISVSPVIIEGQSKGIIAFYQDITKQKNILEKLKESEKKYRNLFENMPEAYYRTDREGNLIMINPEGAKLFGYNSSKDILGKNISQHSYFTSEERKKYLKELEKNKGNLKDFELTLKKKDGTPLVISDTSHYYYDKEGNIAGVEGIFIDITERKKAEENLQKSQQELASLFKNIPQAVVYLDENSNIKNISPRFTELFGYMLEEIKSRNINDGMIHPPGKIEEGKNLDKTASSEGYFNYESIRKKKDGTLFPVSISGSNIIIDGQLKGIIGTYFDITERKKTEETLRKSQQEFAGVFRNSPEALVYVDEDANIININPRFTELFGYTLEEIKGRNLNDGMIHPPNKMEEGKKLDKIAFSEGYFNYETIRKKKDGTLFPVLISGSNIVIDRQLKGGIGSYIDITERKKLEEKLLKLAHYDVLTSCYSRGYGLALLEEQIKTANRKKTPILLLYLDIDEFKEINDTYGHKEGDRVLKEVVQLFKSTLRKIDIICRMGGDEFLLIFLESSLNDAPMIRERLNTNLKKLNQKPAKPYKIDFSIGLSYYDPSNPLSIEELIKIADENMYEEKKKKKEGK